MIDEHDVERLITELGFGHDEVQLRQNQDLALAVGAKVLDIWMAKREELKEAKLKHYATKDVLSD
jgi:hypothetical protein